MGIKQKASATVEALLIMPVILTFILSIAWLADIIGIHSEIGGVVNNVGNSLVAYSYAYNTLSEESLKNKSFESAVYFGISEGYLRHEIAKTRSNSEISALACSLGSITDEEITLSVSYKVEPPIKVPGFRGFYLKNTFYSKAYTGCHEEVCDDELVYITRTGEVYHTATDCRALKVTVKNVSSGQISSQRNKSGGKYYPCEKCAKAGSAATVFITPYGNRYHYDRDCYEINSIWFEVPHSKVKERRKCKFCP
ncbi:MAG: hypothetical protein K6E19_08115 [Lachnospiraceae bacterium]|nr:hypothetical protein [Lachnospiraceae bacterium]